MIANPPMLGPPATAHSRLTFAQAFNSLGTTIFPYVGSILILQSFKERDPVTLTGAALNAFRVQESQVIVLTYLGLAIALSLVAWVVWARRNRLQAHRIARRRSGTLSDCCGNRASLSARSGFFSMLAPRLRSDR